MVGAVAVALIAARAHAQTATVAAATTAPDVTVGASTGRVEGLRLEVFAAPFLGPEAGTSVLVGLEVRGVLRAGDGEPPPLDIHYEVSPPSGTVVTRSVRVQPNVPIAGDRDVIARVLTRVQLQPGRHTLRVTASGPTEARSGAVVHAVDVPDLASPRGTIEMAGLLLGVSTAADAAHADANEEHRHLPILLRPPTTRRAFARDERLEVFAEIYDWSGSDLEFDQLQLGIVTRVRTPPGDVVYTTEDIGQSETLTNGRHGYAHSALLPIASLAPGQYVLEVEVRRLDGSSEAVQRGVPFRVSDPTLP